MEEKIQPQGDNSNNSKKTSESAQENKIPNIRPVIIQIRDNSVKKDK